MTTHILNSAIMPAEGCYSLKRISKLEFAHAIFKAHEEGEELKSWIGYKQNIEVIKQIAHVKLPICRDVTQLHHGDRLLIMRLKYRPDALTKGKPVNAEDFEYFEGFYTERVPIPSYIDILNMDIYEPEAQRYINEIAQLMGAGTVLQALNHTRQLMRELPDGEEQRWRELDNDYTDLLRMQFDPAGYIREKGGK